MRQPTHPTGTDASLYRQDWTCHHASRHPHDEPFIPCQDCHRPRYSPDQATDTPRQETPRGWRIRAGREYYAFARIPTPWTTDQAEASIIYGTRAELRHALDTWPATSPAITFEPAE